ncbi:hypothetical protein ZWY2020_057390 [Hordeum vulgare]|nr:hypothetical protein ZWY2020_057390 [Hordeum vulgare]
MDSAAAFLVVSPGLRRSLLGRPLHPRRHHPRGPPPHHLHRIHVHGGIRRQGGSVELANADPASTRHVASAQLSDTLTAAHKGVNALPSCSSLAKERESGEEESDAKRHCVGASTKFAALETLALPFYNLRLQQPHPPHFPSPRGQRPPAPR